MFNQRWFRALFRRRFVFVLIVISKFMFLVYALVSTGLESKIFATVLEITSLAVALALVIKPDIAAYKTVWIFLIFLSPLLGGIVYIFFNHQTSSHLWQKSISNAEKNGRAARFASYDAYRKAEAEIPDRMRCVNYLSRVAGFPIYSSTDTVYLSPGEKKWEAVLKELENAEKYIFIEYFIIQEGEMWNSILEILKKKAKAGVKIRVIYDDFGCFMLLPKNYKKILKSYGIECAVFNPFVPFLTSMQNNRDHRKIISVDGRVAFTGGINLADEYVNKKERHGHWKDAAVMLSGDAAWSLTAIFLQNWQICTATKENYTDYLPVFKERDVTGYVQPYADSPTDKEHVSAEVYLGIIQSAKEYVYIYTPYLILDDVFVSTLKLAAKSGIDIRIITPHIADKRFVYETTRSYYCELIQAGVRIYEYTPGFVHAKTLVSDDKIASVGTANLDYRSLYLNFECGTVMYGTAAVCQLKEDFLNTLSLSAEITEDDLKCSRLKNLKYNILRVFAPLM